MGLALMTSLLTWNTYLPPWVVLQNKSEHFTFTNQHLPVQIQQWKHQNSMWNLFRFKNISIRRLFPSFRCLYCWLWLRFMHCSCLPLVGFDQANASWVFSFSCFNFFKVKSNNKTQSASFCFGSFINNGGRFIDTGY